MGDLRKPISVHRDDVLNAAIVWPPHAIKIYDVRFVRPADVRPTDVVVPVGTAEFHRIRYCLDRTLRKVRQAIRDGVRSDLDECRTFAADLEGSVRTARRTVAVKRPVI